MAVSTEESVVNAMAGSGWRSKRRRDRNSPAICWASAALPPLPASITLPPASYVRPLGRWRGWRRQIRRRRPHGQARRASGENARRRYRGPTLLDPDARNAPPVGSGRRGRPQGQTGGRARGEHGRDDRFGRDLAHAAMMAVAAGRLLARGGTHDRLRLPGRRARDVGGAAAPV